MTDQTQESPFQGFVPFNAGNGPEPQQAPKPRERRGWPKGKKRAPKKAESPQVQQPRDELQLVINAADIKLLFQVRDALSPLVPARQRDFVTALSRIVG